MADDLKSLGEGLINALTYYRDMPHSIGWDKSDRSGFFVRLLRLDADAAPQEAKPKRARSMSADGTGRGTGRGEKAAASKLTRFLKDTGRRAEFVKFIGGNEQSIDAVMKRFKMSRPNVNGFLTNINRDHGLGYVKDNATVRLVLPAGCTWSNIWG